MKINQAFTILQQAGGIRAARIITENTAGAKGKYISVEYEDIINPKPIKNISAHEIIDNIKNKIDNMNKFTK
jgi:hypothetical protein